MISMIDKRSSSSNFAIYWRQREWRGQPVAAQFIGQSMLKTRPSPVVFMQLILDVFFAVSTPAKPFLPVNRYGGHPNNTRLTDSVIDGRCRLPVASAIAAKPSRGLQSGFCEVLPPHLGETSDRPKGWQGRHRWQTMFVSTAPGAYLFQNVEAGNARFWRKGFSQVV
jgi:hypothetical protein